MLDEATLLTAFTGHGDDAELGIVRLCINDDGMTEEDRTSVVLPAPSTYAHVLDVGDAGGRLLVVTRSIDWCPTGLWVNPRTLDVSAPFQMVMASRGTADPHRLPGVGGRPYFVTRQLPGRVLIALVNDHPGAYRNGVVVAELSGGWWRRIDGTPLRAVDDPSDWDAFEILDRVAAPGDEWVPWVHDITRDSSGRTAVAWSERRHPSDGDAIAGLRYRVAEERDGTWFVRPALHAGAALYAGEPDYAGGICFSAPDATDRLWIVSSVDPLSGDDQAERRLYSVQFIGDQPGGLRVKLERGGDVMRPRVSTFDAGGTRATWYLAGRYTSYKDFGTRPNLLLHGLERDVESSSG